MGRPMVKSQQQQTTTIQKARQGQTATKVNKPSVIAELQTYKNQVSMFQTFCPVLCEYLEEKIKSFTGG